jgi:hypothetical protein
MKVLLLLFTLPFLGGKQEYQILVALGCSAPRALQNQYREMLANEVLPLLASRLQDQSLRLYLAPITGRSYTAPVRVIETPDALLSNRFQLEAYKATFKKEVLSAFGALRKQASAECSKGTEIIGALKAAGERAKGPGKILVMAHGFEQSELMNLYDYRLGLEKPEVRRKLLERVKAKLGLPKLQRQEICFTGLSAGNDNNANARLTGSIKEFWEELITESGGQLVGYGFSPRICPFW